MIGIINLEEIVEECLNLTNITHQILPRLVRSVSDGEIPSQLILPGVEPAKSKGIWAYGITEIFPENSYKPLELISSVLNGSHTISLNTRVIGSDKYLNIESCAAIRPLLEEPIFLVSNTSRKTRLGRKIKAIARKKLNSAQEYFESLNNIWSKVSCSVEEINSTNNPTHIINYSSVKLELIPHYLRDEDNKIYQIERNMVATHIIAHSIIINTFIQQLKPTYEPEKLYFCFGNRSALLPEVAKAEIKPINKDVCVINLTDLKEKRPLLTEYELKGLIGTGSYKKTYKGHDIFLEQDVALKLIHIPTLAKQDNIQRAIKAKLKDNINGNIEEILIKIFQEEAKLMLQATRARSLNLTQIYKAYYSDERKLYIIVEELGEETLADVLAREGKLTPEKTYDCIKQIINGLKQLHKLGFVHGDLKPENILVNKDGTVRITDFGWSSQIPLLSKHYDDPRYLTNLLTSAPEVFDGGHSTELSDLWSVGVISYRMMTGEWPFQHGFTGTPEEWKTLPLEKKQEHAGRIRKEMSNIDKLKLIQKTIYELQKPYCIDYILDKNLNKNEAPETPFIIKPPFNVFGNLFSHTILAGTSPDSKTTRAMGFTYLNSHTELT